MAPFMILLSETPLLKASLCMLAFSFGRFFSEFRNLLRRSLSFTFFVKFGVFIPMFLVGLKFARAVVLMTLPLLRNAGLL